MHTSFYIFRAIYLRRLAASGGRDACDVEAPSTVYMYICSRLLRRPPRARGSFTAAVTRIGCDCGPEPGPAPTFLTDGYLKAAAVYEAYPTCVNEIAFLGHSATSVQRQELCEECDAQSADNSDGNNRD